MSDTRHVKVGELVEIAFDVVASGGYVWQPVIPPEGEQVLAVEGSDRRSPDNQAVGAPSQQTFRFRALQRGSVPVTFVCRRPWEQTPATEEHVTIEIE